MDVNYYKLELLRNRKIFENLFSKHSKEFHSWKRDENSWSFLEVLCHLLDEEREDFRLRLQSLWIDPKADFVPIDPVNWPQSRKYLDQDFEVKLDEFLAERSQSIQYLDELDTESDNWNNTKVHPNLGALSPAFYLHNWLAHDFLHIRQLTRIRYDYLTEISGISVAYAGNWK